MQVGPHHPPVIVVVPTLPSSSYFRCHRPHIAIVSSLSSSSYFHGRVPHPGNDNDVLWPLIHCPPVVTAAGRHVIIIVMGSGVIFSTSTPQLNSPTRAQTMCLTLFVPFLVVDILITF
jgi:hypothetical protein